MNPLAFHNLLTSVVVITGDRDTRLQYFYSILNVLPFFRSRRRSRDQRDLEGQNLRRNTSGLDQACQPMGTAQVKGLHTKSLHWK